MPNSKIDRRNFLRGSGALAAGVALGANEAAATDGQKLQSCQILTSDAGLDPARPEMARLISRACAKLGMDFAPAPLEYSQAIQRALFQHDFDMFLVSFAGTPDRIDPDAFVYLTQHSSQYKAGGMNWTGLSDSAYDKLAEAQRGELDLDRRKQLIFDAQQRIADNHSYTVMMYPDQTNAHRTDRLRQVYPMLGEGIGSFWTDVQVEIIEGDPFYRVGHTVDPKTLNPLTIADSVVVQELRLIYDRLFQIGLDGKVVPWAAKSFQVVDNNTIDVTLREGMKFHDGMPVTADDVVFTADYCRKWKSPAFLSQLEPVKSFEATSKYQLRLSLKEPFAPIFANLLAALFILPKHIWQDIPEKAGIDDPLKYANSKPIGSGPFRFEHYYPNRELKLIANSDHFNAPKCAGLLRINYGSHDALAAAIEKKECDATRYILNANLADALKRIPNVEVRGYSNHGFYLLSYNMKKRPFSDRAFRQAMGYLIPKDLIRETLLNGYAAPGGSVIAPANAFWHNPTVKALPDDATLAKKVLSDAGYTWVGGKLHYPA